MGKNWYINVKIVLVPAPGEIWTCANLVKLFGPYVYPDKTDLSALAQLERVYY